MCSNCGCNTLTQAAESVSDLKLKKDSCCCGATKKTPCICMILGSQCSSVKPMCPCYRLLSVQTKDEKNAEEGDNCPSCANSCKHDDTNMIKVESIYDYEVQSPTNMVIQVTCLECGESGTFFADEVDWEQEDTKLRYSPQIAVNMMNPTYGDLKCPRCYQRFEMAAEEFWKGIDSPSKIARMQRNYENLSHSLYDPTMEYNEIVESKLEKFPSTVDYYGIEFTGGDSAIHTTKNKNMTPSFNAEYVGQLTSSQQREIESRLRDALSYLPPEDFEDALENGMDSKIKDLADTIDIEEFFAETFDYCSQHKPYERCLSCHEDSSYNPFSGCECTSEEIDAKVKRIPYRYGTEPYTIKFVSDKKGWNIHCEDCEKTWNVPYTPKGFGKQSKDPQEFYPLSKMFYQITNEEPAWLQSETFDYCEFCPNDVKVLSEDDGYSCVGCGALTCHGCGSGDEEKHPYCSNCLDAETFESAVVAKKLPKTPVQKAMLNRAMMEQAEIEHTILDLETKARLGLLDEKALMQSLAKKFGAEGAEEIAAYYQDFKEKHPELHETFVLRVANEDSWWGEYSRNKSYKDVQAETAQMLAELGYDFDMIDDYWETVGYDLNPIYETCPDCEGEGIIITRYYPATRDDPADADYVNCEMCEGEGKVLDNPLFDSENEEGSKAFMVAGIAVLSALSFGIYRRFRK